MDLHLERGSRNRHSGITLNQPEVTPEQLPNSRSYFIAVHYWEETENKETYNIPRQHQGSLQKQFWLPGLLLPSVVSA